MLHILHHRMKNDPFFGRCVIPPSVVDKLSLSYLLVILPCLYMQAHLYCHYVLLIPNDHMFLSLFCVIHWASRSWDIALGEFFHCINVILTNFMNGWGNLEALMKILFGKIMFIFWLRTLRV